MPVSQARFLQSLLRQRPKVRRSPGIAGWLAKRGIGQAQDGWVHYRDADFGNAAQLLLAAGIEIPGPSHLLGETPAVASARSSLRDSGPLTHPRQSEECLLAVSMINGYLGLPSGAWFAALPQAAALALRPEAILVCETLAGLRAAPSLPWVAEKLRGRRTLSVFRGGKDLFPRARVGRLLASADAPVLSLCSFSSDALVEADAMPRFEDICWPPEHQLNLLVNSGAGLNPAQAARLYRAGLTLNGCSHPMIERAWAQVRQRRRVVDCDAMLAAAGVAAL